MDIRTDYLRLVLYSPILGNLISTYWSYNWLTLAGPSYIHLQGCLREAPSKHDIDSIVKSHSRMLAVVSPEMATMP